VVQNSNRTILPLMDAFENFSPSVDVALKRGAGSLGLLGRAFVAKVWLYADGAKLVSSRMQRRTAR
jgi:hypothetical protein